jgi:hypothetical protein
MLPKYHLLLGIAFSFLIWAIFPRINIFGAGLIFSSSFLIDFDHYLYYAFKKKDINPGNSVGWFMHNHQNKTLEKWDKSQRAKGKKTKAAFCIFHTFELLMLVLALSFFFYPFLFILIGLLFHQITDAIDLGSRKILHLREYSLMLYSVRRNKQGWTYF